MAIEKVTRIILDNSINEMEIKVDIIHRETFISIKDTDISMGINFTIDELEYLVKELSDCIKSQTF